MRGDQDDIVALSDDGIDRDETPGRPVTLIPYSGRTIELLSPASQTLNLTGDGTAPATELLSWGPSDNQAGEIEVKARMVGVLGGLGSVPIVRFAVEFGHGSTQWDEPQGQLPIIAGTPQLNYTLPARGMVFRLSVREFRIRFSNAGVLAGPALSRITVQVSINPVYGGQVQAFPYTQLAFPTVGVVQPFPMQAREWRLTDNAGLPVGAGPGVAFVGITGALFGINPASSFSTFQPIPHDAVSFLPTATMYAHYR